jgi:hypothetical protein
MKLRIEWKDDPAECSDLPINQGFCSLKLPAVFRIWPDQCGNAHAGRDGCPFSVPIDKISRLLR